MHSPIKAKRPNDRRDPRVQLLLTGNEIMSGDTVDSNSAMIAQRLEELAIGVYRKVTVGDDAAAAAAELAAMAADADLVIVNGGLGPTIDDLTAEILAAVAGVELAEHPEAVAHLRAWCAPAQPGTERRQPEAGHAARRLHASSTTPSAARWASRCRWATAGSSAPPVCPANCAPCWT